MTFDQQAALRAASMAAHGYLTNLMEKNPHLTRASLVAQQLGEALRMAPHHQWASPKTALRTEKPCSMCKVLQPLEDFWRCAQSSDGRQGACRPCMRMYRQRHRRAA